MTTLNLNRRRSEGARVLRADAPALIWATVIAVLVILAAAFLISFQSLTAVAIAAHMPAWVAPAFPVAVDGLIAVATFAAVILEPRSKALRFYGFLVLILGASISVWANGLHSVGTAHLTPAERWTVGATAPIALVLGTHLLTLLLKPAARPLSDDEIRAGLRAEVEADAAAKSAAAALLVAQAEVEAAALRKAVAEEARAAVAAEVIATPTVRGQTRPATVTTGSRTQVITVIERLAAESDGVRPSIPVIVAEAGCSESTAKRARAEWEANRDTN